MIGALVGGAMAVGLFTLSLRGGARVVPSDPSEPMLSREPRTDKAGNEWRPELIRTERVS